MKQKPIILFFFLVVSTLSPAQTPKHPLRIDAVALGYNYIINSNYNRGKSGFNISAYRTLRDGKVWQIIPGVSYNYLPYYSPSEYDSHFSHYKHVSYKLHFLSLNLATRFVFGKQKKVFFSFGYFYEPLLFNFNAATYYIHYPYQAPQTYNVKNKVDYLQFQHGLSAAIGALIPLNQKHIALKLEFRRNPELNHLRFSVGYEW